VVQKLVEHVAAHPEAPEVQRAAQHAPGRRRQLKPADVGRAQRGRVGPEAGQVGPHLVAHVFAAHPVEGVGPALGHGHGVAPPGQVEGRRQTGQAAADDENVHLVCRWKVLANPEKVGFRR